MRSFVFRLATFLIAAAPVFPQSPAAPVSTNEGSQKDEQQIRQIEAEMLKGEMNSDPAVIEKLVADDCVFWPAGPTWTKAKLLDGIRKSQGLPPPYIATDEDMHIYVLGETAIAIYVKRYAVRENPDHIDLQDLTNVFVRTSGNWKLKISRSSPHKKTEN